MITLYDVQIALDTVRHDLIKEGLDLNDIPVKVDWFTDAEKIEIERFKGSFQYAQITIHPA
jgi:hypothetical protein